MKVKSRKKVENENTKKEYSRATRFFDSNRNLGKTAGPNEAQNTLIELRKSKEFNITALFEGIDLNQYKTEIRNLYNYYLKEQDPIKHTIAINIINESVAFYHTHVSETITLDSVESIVLCHPYLDAISASILYHSSNQKTKPYRAEFGITHTFAGQHSGVTGATFVIGLDWNLMAEPENDYRELRDTVLHELAHAHMFIEGKCDEQYEKYERHTEVFCRQMAKISEAFYRKNNIEFEFGNIGPHHKKVKEMEDLNIKFDPKDPKACLKTIETYFNEWNEAFDNEPNRLKRAKKSSGGRPEAKKSRKTLGNSLN